MSNSTETKIAESSITQNYGDEKKSNSSTYSERIRIKDTPFTTFKENGTTKLYIGDFLIDENVEGEPILYIEKNKWELILKISYLTSWYNEQNKKNSK